MDQDLQQAARKTCEAFKGGDIESARKHYQQFSDRFVELTEVEIALVGGGVSSANDGAPDT